MPRIAYIFMKTTRKDDKEMIQKQNVYTVIILIVLIAIKSTEDRTYQQAYKHVLRIVDKL